MPADATPLTDHDVQAIRALTAAHERAVLDHDPDTFLATCTDDIVFLPPDQPILVGRSACRTFLQDFPRPATVRTEVHEVEGQGSLAFSRGGMTAGFDDGTSATFKWVAVHRKQPDGSWKMARDMWSADAAAGP